MRVASLKIKFRALPKAAPPFPIQISLGHNAVDEPVFPPIRKYVQYSYDYIQIKA
jgi:hypothetical protein